MPKTPAIAELGAQTYAKWLSACWITSVASIAGFCWTVSHPDGHPLVFAFSVSWGIALVVAAVTRDAFLRMDPRRFGFARWEREGRIYRRMGIVAFGWLLQHSALGWLNPNLKLTCRRSGLERLLREMAYAEGAHWIGGVVTVGIGIRYFAAGHTSIAVCLVTLTIFFHAYPVMLQRWNRGRVLRLIRRQDTHAKAPVVRKNTAWS